MNIKTKIYSHGAALLLTFLTMSSAFADSWPRDVNPPQRNDSENCRKLGITCPSGQQPRLDLGLRSCRCVSNSH